MDFPELDPYPYGCPIGVLATPSEMSLVVRDLCVRLRDVLHASIVVIRPSKGQSYPLLQLYGDESDAVPRVVLFPAWEADKRDPKRRIGYGRQMTLLRRMHDGGVRGEAIPSGEASLSSTAMLVPLAVAPHQMRDLAVDLVDRLGDCLRFSGLEQGSALMVRAYGPGEEATPRLLLHAAWRQDGEGDDDIVSGAWVLSQIKGAVEFRL